MKFYVTFLKPSAQLIWRVPPESAARLLADIRLYVVVSANVLDPMCLDKSCHSWGRTGPTRGSRSSITQSLSKRPD